MTALPTRPPELVTLRIDQIVRDPALQLRVKMDEHAVADFMKRVLEGERFPPVDVFLDQAGTYLLAHGFHRMKAHDLAGRAEVEVRLHRGERSEALLFAAKANRDQQGVRWTDQDAARAAESLLREPAYWSWSNARIAGGCGSTPPTVGRIRARIQAERAAEGDEGGAESLSAPLVRVGSDGREVRIPTAADRLGPRLGELAPLRARLEQLQAAGVRKVHDDDKFWWVKTLLNPGELDRVTVATLDRLLRAVQQAEDALHAATQAPAPERLALVTRLEGLADRGIPRLSWRGAEDQDHGDEIPDVLGQLFTLPDEDLPALERAVRRAEGGEPEDDSQQAPVVQVAEVAGTPVEPQPGDAGMPAEPCSELVETRVARLPLDAPAPDIAALIEAVNAQHADGHAEALPLASAARDQLDRASRMAKAVGMELHALHPHGAWWTGGASREERTVLQVRGDGIAALRAAPSGKPPGRLSLSLFPPTQVGG